MQFTRNPARVTTRGVHENEAVEICIFTGSRSKMPTKAEMKTLITKINNSARTFGELIEEFEVLFETKPQIEQLSAVFTEIETKYRAIKKQQESISNKLSDTQDDSIKEIEILGSKVKTDYLQIAKRYAIYQKENQCSPQPQQAGATAKTDASAIDAMTAAVTKMAEALGTKKAPNSLERLPVPAWDGNRRTYATWKKEFNHAMKKYSQDPDEQLQRFRKAMPKNSWWTEQVKTCKSVSQAWEILDIEFENKRKLMDSLLAEINNLKPVKRDSKSLTMFATTIQRYVNDMEDNGCSVTTSSDSPFFMSQLLSKLDSRDNVEFGREMNRVDKDENVKNLLNWLHQEASLRSRGRKDLEGDEKPERSQRVVFQKRSDTHAMSSSTPQLDDETCPLGCTEKHLLQACPIYQSSTVNQRWEVVKRHHRCRKCLRASHHTDDCKKPNGQSCDKCKRNHHRSLHNDKKESVNSSDAVATPTIEESISTKNNNVQGRSATIEKKIKMASAICPVQIVKIRNSDGDFVECLALLDSGSNTTLLSKKFAKQLGLKGTDSHLTMNLAGGKCKSEKSTALQINLVPVSEPSIQKTILVYTVDKPCSSATTISKNTVCQYQHLKDVAEELYLSGGSVDLLIGTNFADAFMDIHVLSGEPGEPIAKRNCFGWYLLGQFNSDSTNNNQTRIQTVNVGTVSAEENIKTLLQQDQIGVKPTRFCTCSDDTLRENNFVKSLTDSTNIVEGRVQVKMPWKKEGPPEQSNYDIALKRMHSAEKSFQKKNCFNDVNKEVEKLVEQGFVTIVPQENIDHNQPEWFLPLQAVFTPEKSTKIRLVFDASSKGHDGRSLNDYLEKGPNYINNLPDVLLAWRWDTVAYSGDIRKMFNQISVHPDDQVFFRFLWRKDQSAQPTVYQWLRLSFGNKPAPDIATNSINMLARTSQDVLPEAAEELLQHAYVDDIAGSKEQMIQAKQITEDIDKILARGCFQIKEWHSNSKEIDQSDGEESVDILGHRWNKVDDTFSFKKDEISTVKGELTKRHCLSLLAKLWDPLGLVTPVTIKFRIDLQELWSAGFDWDNILPNEIQMQWMKNLKMINQLFTSSFNRQLKPHNAVGQPEVHGFSDAGDLAFGAVIFLRWLLNDSSYHVVPVLVKAFVTPLKKKSIPRLELLGCLTLARMYDACIKALNFARIQECKRHFWVDSSTVLSWIKTPPRDFRPYVSVRVAEVQETVGSNDFSYIPSKENPADALTRGISIENLEKWMQGPAFLSLPESQWPEFTRVSMPTPDENVKQDVEKEKRPRKNTVQTECSTVKADKIEDMKDNPILAHLLMSCSTFSKMRRTLAYVKRFSLNAQGKSKMTGPITVQELINSENQLFRWCQVHLIPSQISQLTPIPDENNLMRAHGRLEKITTLPREMKNPIVLPGKHKLVELLLQHIHKSRGHCGYKSLIHESRKKFWIVGVREIAKRLTRSCVLCKKLRKKPLEQLMGQLPNLRVATGQAAFTNTALDMFGPLQIRLNRKTLKESQVIIFACMTTRAIHLELVTDRSTDTFLMAFRRFASLRGHPKVCYSDCGTNFVGAQNYLNDISKIQNTLTEDFSCDLHWEWNTPKASHQNGVVETLIKSVRQALNASCKDNSYTEEQWRTILYEVTYLVNGRPLYPSSNEIWERPPITPNDLLIGNHQQAPQPASEDRINPRDLTKSTQQRIYEFWRCWMKYFAPNLLPRNKWFHTKENIQDGDVVLEIDPNHKRSKWKMGLITATYPGSDGLIRKVKIKTEKGEYYRPIHKLCLIATKKELDSE